MCMSAAVPGHVRMTSLTNFLPLVCRKGLQIDAYRDCLNNYRERHQFMGFIDVDEVGCKANGLVTAADLPALQNNEISASTALFTLPHSTLAAVAHVCTAHGSCCKILHVLAYMQFIILKDRRFSDVPDFLRHMLVRKASRLMTHNQLPWLVHPALAAQLQQQAIHRLPSQRTCNMVSWCARNVHIAGL